MKQIYRRYILACNVSVLLFFLSCDGGEHPVPNVPVNIIVNTDLPLYQSLKVTGGWSYVDGGSKGIVLYNHFDDIIALDRHSTINSSNPCARVFINPENQFELIDTCSNVVYSVITGVVTEGAAEFPLRSYNTTWDGNLNITVNN